MMCGWNLYILTKPYNVALWHHWRGQLRVHRCLDWTRKSENIGYLPVFYVAPLFRARRGPEGNSDTSVFSPFGFRHFFSVVRHLVEPMRAESDTAARKCPARQSKRLHYPAAGLDITWQAFRVQSPNSAWSQMQEAGVYSVNVAHRPVWSVL